MNTKHTPAPWVAIKGDRGYIITNEDSSYDIAIVRNVAQRFDNEANARLIAAAPELLEALKHCAAVCAGEVVNKNGLINALELARTAIAKATGEQA